MATGQPNITMIFKTLGTSAFKRSQKGVIAMVLVDTEDLGEHVLTSITETPTKLGVENKAYLERTWIGYINPPKSIQLLVIDGTEKTLTDALVHFSNIKFDYLVLPPDVSATDVVDVATWIKLERDVYHMVKAVLPNAKADTEGIVNFTTDEILTDEILASEILAGENLAGEKTYSPAQYCSRIAGIIAGTPMQISATYATLPEVKDIKRLTRAEMDKAANNGEFIIFHDMEKYKTGRAVNSLTTTTQDKGDSFKKIKIVEVVDMVTYDIRSTLQDSYIGKYANSYDNKCLLLMALQGYFEGLEIDGILARGTSNVEIDVERQENYLKAKGIDTENMSIQEIKEANTGSEVFLLITISILDAIEDVHVVAIMI